MRVWYAESYHDLQDGLTFEIVGDSSICQALGIFRKLQKKIKIEEPCPHEITRCLNWNFLIFCIVW
jgi:hypothetical protein